MAGAKGAGRERRPLPPLRGPPVFVLPGPLPLTHPPIPSSPAALFPRGPPLFFALRGQARASFASLLRAGATFRSRGLITAAVRARRATPARIVVIGIPGRVGRRARGATAR